MNNFLVKSLLFVSGTVVGFLTAKVVYTKYYENLIETEINSVKDLYDQALKESLQQFANDVIAESKTIKAKKTDAEVMNFRNNKSAIVRDADEMHEGNQYNKVKGLYNIDGSGEEDEDDSGHPSDYEDEDDIGDEYLDDTAYGNPVEYIPNPIPYVITEMSFNNDEPEFDKISLDFYMDDNILVDENSEELVQTDALNMIGTNGFDILSAATQDTILYVRNEKYRTDYEIGTVNDSYKDTAEYEERHPVNIKPVNIKPVILVPSLDKKNLTPREAFELRQKIRSERDGK